MKRFALLAALMTALAGCKQQVSESDAIFYAYCVLIYPSAEVAIQRGFLNYAPGTFTRVQMAAEQSFPAPIEWSKENQNIFQREAGRARNHGGAIHRGDIQRNDITRLNACIDWAGKL